MRRRSKMGDPMVPALRFPTFGENWFYDTIGGILDKDLIYAPKDGNHGSLHPKSEDFIDEGIPFIMAKDILNGRVQTTMAVKISEAQANSLHKGFSINGDVLLTHKGSIGETALLDNITDYIVLSPQVTYYRVKDEKYLHNRYIKAFFESPQFQKNIKILAQSGTRPYVGITEQKELRFSYPELPEQQKIADFLFSVDKKIEQLTRKKELLEKYKTGMMQKLFPKAGEQHPELRFKDENGQDFPDWNNKKLSNLLDLVVDNRGKTPPLSSSGYPLLEVNSIGNKKIKYFKVSKYVSEITYENWFRKHIEKGDILFSTVGQTALCSFYDDEFKSVIAQNIVGLRFFNSNSLFMYYLLTQQESKKKFKSIEMKAVQPSIKVTQMIKLRFNLPEFKEQQKIADFLSAIDDKITKVEGKLTKAQTFKKGLLQQMFV